MRAHYLVPLLFQLEAPLGFATKQSQHEDEEQHEKGIARGNSTNVYSSPSPSQIIHYIRALQVQRDVATHKIFYLDIFHSLCLNAMPDAYRTFESREMEDQFQVRMGKIALHHFTCIRSLQVRVVS